MLLVVGECDRVTEREAGSPGNTWIERTIVVRDWGATLFCTVAREFRGSLPNEGERVALDVIVRAYVRKDGSAGYGFTALGRNAEAERQLLNAPAVKAV